MSPTVEDPEGAEWSPLGLARNQCYQPVFTPSPGQGPQLGRAGRKFFKILGVKVMLPSPPPASPLRDPSGNNWTRAGNPLPKGVEGRKSPGWVEPPLALSSHSFLFKKNRP